MGFFNKKRADGTLVKAREAYSMIMPYIMPTRTESLVYYNMTIDIANARKYLQAKRKEGVNMSFFSLVIAACVKTFEQYPRLNRFVAGKRLYQRNSLDVCYTVKREMSTQGDESTARLTFAPGSTASSVTEQMNKEIAEKKDGAEGTDDKLIGLLEHTPRFLITFLMHVVRRLDYYGVLPKVIREGVPFWCSLFVSNLGSLGMQSPFHHLYELGTCSLFLTIGRIDKHFDTDRDGRRIPRMTVDFGMTVDERIVDGFYLSRAIACFNNLMANPDLLD